MTSPFSMVVNLVPPAAGLEKSRQQQAAYSLSSIYIGNRGWDK